jgi:hypothetical protein
MRSYVPTMMDTRGLVADDDLVAFVAAGFSERNAPKVVLRIGTHTLSTYANRLVRAPLVA